METLSYFHNAEENAGAQRFSSGNEVVGWIDIHGLSKPVTAVVIGREMRGIVSNSKGEVKIKVQTYIKPAGNEYPLGLIKNSQPHEGWSGKEYEITENVSPEYAMKLQYSPPASETPTTQERVMTIDQHALISLD